MFTDFESLAGGLASLFTVAAIIVGGAWAVYSRRMLLEIPRRKAELQALELQNQRQAVVEITINARGQHLPGDPETYIAVEVEILNTGTRNTRLGLSEEMPFSVWSVTFLEDGELQFGEPMSHAVNQARRPNQPASSLVVRAGGRERIPFFVRVPSAGLYYLAFTTLLDPNAAARSMEAGTVRRTRWVARTFVVVE